MPAQLNYEHAPLRLCMAQLAERFRFSYWIDRRVDADRPLNLTLTDSTLGQCLARLAAQCDAEVGLIENVITIAGKEQLASMQYAAVRLHDLLSRSQSASDTETAASQATLKPIAWSMLTTPDEMLSQINALWKLSLPLGLPHDLMDAGALQPCTVSTQLALVLGGFDRCAAGKTLAELRIVPLPKAAAWRATYAVGMVHERSVAALSTTFPDARLDKSDRHWTLVGLTAAHLSLLQAGGASTGEPSAATQSPRGSTAPRRTRDSGKSSVSDPLSTQRYTISKLENKPVRDVLAALTSQLGLTLKWDSTLPPTAAQTLVTLEANQARLDDILARLSAQSGLSIHRENTVLHVTAKATGN